MENNLSFLRSRGREKCCQCHKRKTELESIKHVRGNKRIGWDRNRGGPNFSLESPEIGLKYIPGSMFWGQRRLSLCVTACVCMYVGVGMNVRMYECVCVCVCVCVCECEDVYVCTGV
jgi:hypothetical protein